MMTDVIAWWFGILAGIAILLDTLHYFFAAQMDRINTALTPYVKWIAIFILIVAVVSVSEFAFDVFTVRRSVYIREREFKKKYEAVAVRMEQVLKEELDGRTQYDIKWWEERLKEPGDLVRYAFRKLERDKVIVGDGMEYSLTR